MPIVKLFYSALKTLAYLFEIPNQHCWAQCSTQIKVCNLSLTKLQKCHNMYAHKLVRHLQNFQSHFFANFGRECLSV